MRKRKISARTFIRGQHTLIMGANKICVSWTENVIVFEQDNFVYIKKNKRKVKKK